METSTPAWIRAALAVALFTCIIVIGAAYVLAGRLVALNNRVEIETLDIVALRTSIDDLANEIRFSPPADLGHKHAAVRDFVIQSQLRRAEDPIVFIGDSITESHSFPQPFVAILS